MGRLAKEHRKKVQARNNRTKQEKEKVQKMQKEFIMNLIKQEQEKGMFENNQNITPIAGLNDSPIIEGPSI